MPRLRLTALVVAVVALIAPVARAIIPDAVPTAILGSETKMGSLIVSDARRVRPASKTIDGNTSDWTGVPTRLAGTSIYSHGEYVYQDHIDDAWGADDGNDEQRVAQDAPLMKAEPRLYRPLEVFPQAAGDQFGAPTPPGALLNYGDTTANDVQRNAADIAEARVAATPSALEFMVRTTGMTPAAEPAVLVLLDTRAGGTYRLARAMGGLTTGAEWALLFTDATHAWVSHLGGAPVPLDATAVWNPSSYVNAVEIAVSRAPITDLSDGVGVGIATGVADPATHLLAAKAPAGAASDLINVAFRGSEPARIWMDENQAFALRDGNIDRFLARVQIHKLLDGSTQTFQQRPGYYERLYFDGTTPVNTGTMDGSYFQGAWQHYGVYLPKGWSPTATYPATFWMHYRGGHANDAAAWEPGILRQFGDEVGAVVFTPSARGTSSWYTGRGMVDFMDAWKDALSQYRVDQNRIDLAGHSMGGWASYLLGLLFPDRWAASNPEDGLLAPGLWTGFSAPSDAQDGADIDAEFLAPLIGNARNLPYAILHGTEDELVPVTSAIKAGTLFQQAGFRYRLYLFHTYEHYSAPLWDDWRDIVQYMRSFARDPNPPHVTYTISPALDHAVSTVSAPKGVDLGYVFNAAYWVSGLQTRVDGRSPSNLGSIDAMTYGRGVQNVLDIPEAGALAQPEVYTMVGQRWLANGLTVPANKFTATLTNLSSATLDLARMGLGTSSVLTGVVTTDGSTRLVLRGHWASKPTVTGVASWSWTSSGLTLNLPAGKNITITIS
jgi:pimeloyl-ACP methyl ester carboxylesterase